MLFMLVCVAGIFLGLAMVVRGAEDSVQITGIVFLIIFGIAALICSFAWPAAYFGSLAAYAELAAAQRIVPEYERAVSQTAGAVVRFESQGHLVDAGQGLANLKHSTNTSERIEEMRNYLARYYDELEKWRIYNSKWFIRRFIAPMPEELLE